VSFRDEDVAVRCDEHVIWLIEVVGFRRATGFAERHQQLALRAELEDLMTARRPWQGTIARRGRVRLPGCRLRAARWRRRLRRIILSVGHPDVAIAIDVQPVREDEHALREARDQFAGRIELEERRQARHLTRCAIETRVRAAALANPDAAPVAVDIDGTGRSPRAAVRHFEKLLDGLIGIGRRVRGLRRLRG
jgi:hypothetical protein